MRQAKRVIVFHSNFQSLMVSAY